MALRSSLVAKIETPVEGGVKVGTAYPIADGYIITAYHVFPDIDDLTNTRVHWQRNDEAREGEGPANEQGISGIRYKSEKYDVVIAECPTPRHTSNVRWCSFDSLEGEWESIGYAKSGQDHQKKVRLKDPAGGTFYTMQDDDWILQLESKGNASKVALWRGMSGAPVFQKNTDNLVAIITETPRRDKEGEPVHEDRLYAISIPYLLKECKEFGEKTDFDDDISVFLKKSSKLVDKEGLAELFKAHEGACPSEPEELCRYLSRQPLPDLLGLIANLQQNHEEKKPELGELVCTLLPYLFDDGKAMEIREGIGNPGHPLAVVSYSSPVSVEMLMSKVDYRSAEISLITKKEFHAKYRLPLPPDSGDEHEALEKETTAGIYQDFAGDQQRLVAANITRRIYDEEVSSFALGSEPDAQEKVDYVRDELAERAKEKEPPQ